MLATRLATTPAPLQNLTVTGYLGYPLASSVKAFDVHTTQRRDRCTLLVPTIVAQALVGEAAKNRHLTVTAQVAGSVFDQLVTLEKSLPEPTSAGLHLWPDRFTVAADTAGVALADMVTAAYPGQAGWPTVA